MQISKSDYMLFLKHPAWLWVKKNDPSKIPLVDSNTQALFDAGHRFEPYAESLFPEGITIGFSFDDSELNYWTMPERTKAAIDSGIPVLFQPRFEWGDFTCICDIISFTSEKELDLYEIKASTGARVDHEYDLAFQVAILEGCGYKVNTISVIHVNNTYVKNGPIDAKALTKIADVSENVRAKGSVTNTNMPQALSVASQKIMPDPSPELAKFGSKNEWLKIYANINPQPPVIYPANTKPTVDLVAIQKFLDSLQYPLYFLDYETMSGLVPYFDGHRPYQQIPFQYSLHIITEPGAAPGHKEYLHRENSDPSRPLLEQLCKDISTSGSVIVWYEGFEKSRNVEMGELIPEYKEAMEALNGRVVDLMVPFKKKWYDDPRFEGSASIKKVLPVVCPELSYKGLGIQEGGSAQRFWMEAILDESHLDQKEQILADLIEYCKLDTLAMVEIFKVLTKLG